MNKKLSDSFINLKVIMEWLYSDATIMLSRKYNKFLEINNLIKK